MRKTERPQKLSPILVKLIPSSETVPIRWSILRPGFPRETAIFVGDDVSTTQHFGGFLGGRLVGVASIYQTPSSDRPAVLRAWQLRGMATLPEVRGLGVGKALVEACESAALEAGDSLLWCNARAGALDFYVKLGWMVSSDEFDIPTVGPHRRMLRVLTPLNPA